jgi:hypothetical protein
LNLHSPFLISFLLLFHFLFILIFIIIQFLTSKNRLFIYIFSNLSDYFCLSSSNFRYLYFSFSLISLNFFMVAYFNSFFRLAFYWARRYWRSSIFFSLSIISDYSFCLLFSLSNWCWTSLALMERDFLYFAISFSNYYSKTKIGSSSSKER